VFPHKEYSGASLQERLELIDRACADSADFSIAVAEGGLFVEIATECRQAYGADVRLSFLCGRDAAERIVGWDYGDSVEFSTMLQNFDILVASRNGEYAPPPELAWAIQRLEVETDFDHVSASEVRDRIARGAPWEHLVPAPIRRHVRRIYGPRHSTGLG
jgi:nicotinic acid mononucleotide adenylyltransferase